MSFLQAATVPRGVYVHSVGRDRNGLPIEVTGYVVIVGRVVDEPRRVKADDPVAVTLAERDDESGWQTTVFFTPDAVVRPIPDVPFGRRYYGR